MNKKNVYTIVFGVFAAIGAIMLVVEIILGVVFSNKKQIMELSEAVITEIYEYGDEHVVYVDYQFDGEFYSHKSLGYYSSSMREGDYTEIYVNPQNPDDIMGKNASNVGLFVVGLNGGTFFLIGGGGLMYRYLRKRRNKRLFREGKRMYGVIDVIDRDLMVSVNNEHPFYAMVAVRDEYSGKEKYYKSEHFWEDVADTIKVGDSAIVYMDPKDDSKYFVDVTGANAIMGSTMAEYY